MPNPKIELHTKLSRWLCVKGAGVDETVRTFKASPRGLVLAAHELVRERENNLRDYGSIGAGDSWLSYRGHDIDTFDLYFVFHPMDATATEEARDLLAMLNNRKRLPPDLER